MKTLLAQVIAAGLRLGRWHLFSYNDGTITARQDKSGLMAPDQKPTVAGLARILKFIDKENNL